MEVAITARAGNDCTVANWLFHREVNKACKSPRLLAMLGTAGRMIPKSFFEVFPEHIPRSLEEHDELVRALQRGDGRTARTITEKHLEGAAELLSAKVAAMELSKEA